MFFTVDELDLSSWGIVEAIDACPPIARGEGKVVISRFKTLQAEELTRIVLADGSEFVGTSVHPVWSVDAEDWVPLADLVAGERLQTRSGEIEIDTVETFAYRQSVYNFEVHTEHVYEIGDLGDLGVLVHDGGGAACRRRANGQFAKKPGPKSKTDLSKERQRAVRQAWKAEQEAVRAGQGTRKWTKAQKAQLLATGKVPGFVGHHVNNVKKFPKLAGDPNNIEFVTPVEHLARHFGNFLNSTMGPLVNR